MKRNQRWEQVQDIQKKWTNYARARGQSIPPGNNMMLREEKMAMEDFDKKPDSQLKLLRLQLRSVKCMMMMCIFDDRKEMMDFFDELW